MKSQMHSNARGKRYVIISVILPHDPETKDAGIVIATISNFEGLPMVSNFYVHIVCKVVEEKELYMKLFTLYSIISVKYKM